MARSRPSRIYYARAIPMIGTEEDLRNIRTLEEAYPGAKIDYVHTLKNWKHTSMKRYFGRVDKADLVVVAESGKGVVAAGTFSEAQHGRHQNKPVKVIRSNKLISVTSFQIVDAKKRNPQDRWAAVKIRKPKT